ncbi:MAG TPA: glycoside hydrolase family 15 protein [Candidatus Didemnitutus sp.]|nr:glycoside hydrolase family 15 protein [Candidatus Didemnitutus sp.]
MKIEDYALIGDSHTAALVGRNGSIDWLCFPDFDSPACFAALVGHEKNGHWQIGPEGNPRATARRYRGDSLVLESDFDTPDGRMRLTDFMPVRRDHGWIVREIAGLRGKVRLSMRLVVAFGYGQIRPWLHRTRNQVRLQAGSETLVLHAPVPVEVDDAAVRASFFLQAGQRFVFMLHWHPSHRDAESPVAPPAARRAVLAQGRKRLRRSTYRGPYRDAVRRSLLVIHALTYAPTGGLAAAPTTSLPEQLGGSRNWDYRYCWLRDMAFAFDALLAAGYGQDAAPWLRWLVRAVAGDPRQLQTAYSVHGERRLSEWIVEKLAGYEGSRPVRVGNDASIQFQLDVYGEVINALHLARSAGDLTKRLDLDAWELQQRLLEQVERSWQKDDHGIWEERGRSRPFTYSKVMAWVAADRTVQAIERGGHSGDLARWRRLRRIIRHDVLTHGFNRRVGAFTQYYGSDIIDASILRLPLVGFLSARDARMRSTVRRIETQLMQDGVVGRRHTGRSAPEAAFLPCSFWLAANYSLAGRKDDARKLFERTLGLANDLGLFAEEYDLGRKRLMGNFPQALTHIALIQGAVHLAQSGATTTP